MPEGPEVRRQADRVRRGIGGEVAHEVGFGLEDLSGWTPQLSGRRVEEVEARGKALLVHFDDGNSVYTHSQLYGRWHVVKPERLPSTNRQQRFWVKTDKKWAVLYSASDIEVWPRCELHQHPFLASLGPEALDPSLDAEQLVERLDAKAFRGRMLASLLLDQGFVAGLGNYLRSEILFIAGVLPRRRPKDLQDSERARLAAAILEITRRSYRTGGITVDEALDKALVEQGVSRRRRRHFVFGRAEQLCRRCSTPIERAEVGGRRVYTCPGCQL